MSIIVLDSTTKSLKVNLSGAVANTNPSFVVTFADTTATAFTEASSDGVLNGTSNVTVVAAPAIATRRVIKNLIIKNNDTAAVTVNLFLDNNGTSRNIAKVTLAVDDTWTLSGTFSSNGSLKQTLGTNNLDLTGTTSAQALTVSGATTLSAGTANGILYLNGSKVATTGSALTFDGTSLGVGATTVAARVDIVGGVNNQFRLSSSETDATTKEGKFLLRHYTNAQPNFLVMYPFSTSTDNAIFYGGGSSSQTAATYHAWGTAANNTTVAGSEQMRLTSTGLGIGTSSPSQKLSIVGTSTFNSFGSGPQITMADTLGRTLAFVAPGSVVDAYVGTITNHTLNFMTGGTGRATIDTSGNLGIGTSSPSTLFHAAGGNPILLIQETDQAANAQRWGIQSETSLFKIRAFNDAMSSATDLLIGDRSGNLGLGVTPSAWNSNRKAIQSGNAAFFSAPSAASYSAIGANVFNNTGGTDTYISSAAASLYLQNAGAHSWYTAPSGTAGNAITFTQAMTLDASGNLGVGITSPAAKLDVRGTTSATIRVGSTGHGGSGDEFGNLEFYWGDPDAAEVKAKIYAKNVGNVGPGGGGAADLLFATTPAFGSSTERARITSGGELLVGVTTSTANGGITLRPSAANPYVYVGGSSSSSSDVGYYVYSSGAGAYRFYVTYAGGIYATSTSITAISDASLKENIRDLETGLPEVMALKPRRFDWKNGDAQNVAGFVAQEVEQILPELVTDYVYNKDVDGNDIIKKSLKMGDILPTLVKAIQEQQALITALTARVATLEGTQP